MDELKNPFSRRTMLFEGHMTSTIEISDGFPNSYVHWLLIQHYMKGEGGLHSEFCNGNMIGVENSYHCMDVPRTFGRHCSLTCTIIRDVGACF